MSVTSRLSSVLRTALRLPGALRHKRRDALSFSARRWSNEELARIAHLFASPIVNVSAWEDSDKQGRYYKDYFPAGADYSISNFGTSQGQLQGREDEFFLDLEAELPSELRGRFATVFNHTTLEHIWDFRRAFGNLCALSSDAVIIVVPWLQPQHADYGDYWRFSPQALVRLFEEESMKVAYLDWNRARRESVYVFAVAVRNPDRWAEIFPNFPLGSSDEGFLALPPDAPGYRAFDL